MTPNDVSSTGSLLTAVWQFKANNGLQSLHCMLCAMIIEWQHPEQLLSVKIELY